jgi:hypothetical protein
MIWGIEQAREKTLMSQGTWTEQRYYRQGSTLWGYHIRSGRTDEPNQHVAVAEVVCDKNPHWVLMMSLTLNKYFVAGFCGKYVFNALVPPDFHDPHGQECPNCGDPIPEEVKMMYKTLTMDEKKTVWGYI